jgi:carboxypeptidase Q
VLRYYKSMYAKSLLLTFAATALAAPVVAVAEERVDLSAIHQIRQEAFENSKVMDHMFYLSDVHGPRVTNSPGFQAAANWAVKRMQEYGIPAKLEKWGPFGRGWTFSHYEGHMVEPQYASLIGFPLAWTPGTNGPLTAEPVHAVIAAEADFAKWKGKLKGKMVLISPVRELPLLTTPLAHRLDEKELADRAQADTGPGIQRRRPSPEFRNKLAAFLKEQGVALVVQSGGIADGGTVFGTSAGSRETKDPVPPTTVVITAEHYNRVVRLLEKKIAVKLTFDIKASFIEDNLDSHNVIAEMEGGAKKDEVVMIGAHLDSWQGGTGATDNAAGSAIMMEAMRILKSMNRKFNRTIRMGLWSGEEQGLLGSRAYVKEHFADPADMKTTAQHAKFAAYFNIDNGTGKLRGVYLQQNDMVRPIFRAWLEPFHDLGATTLSIRNTGGTDHLSFNDVGLPGFQFIQDPVEYSTRTHHSNMDVYDRVQKGDLMQAAAIIAAFAYHASERAEMLPRKPLPKPRPRNSDAPRGERPATSGGGQ